MIKVYYASIREGTEEDWEKLRSSLPFPERLERADRFRFEDDKRRCILAGALLKTALFNEGIRDPEIEKGPQGKPYLKSYTRVSPSDSTQKSPKNGPDCDPQIQFSLSHSGDLSVCAIGTAPVGVDVELIKPTGLSVAKRFFTEKEFDHISQSLEKEAELLRIWTLKESYLKMTGEGLKHPLDSFEIIPKNPGHPEYQNHPGSPGHPEYQNHPEYLVSSELKKLKIREFALPRHHISVCSQEEIEPDLIRLFMDDLLITP
ncbi:MAG: 4'-phosphopantetheinyl transferase superfamily protein [Lachnospiraceae bacterium]|nr:4'-phosphopantetheinyl transferase superfamily protein [Lachnospiraceae bacterium]